MSGQDTGFRTKVLNSAKLSTLKFASDVGLRLVSTVVLTRILAPEIYGVFAIVLVYLYLLEMFSDLGIRTLVLTKEGAVTDDFLHTCWSVTILRGSIIAAASVLIGAAIGLLQGYSVFDATSAYANSVLPWAIAALGLGSLIVGFMSPNQYMSERNMSFGRVTLAYVMTNVVGLVATIVLALYLRSIWALVLGNIAKGLTQVLLSFVLFHGPRMRPYLGRENLAIVLGRGKWIVGNSILTAFSQSADRLMLGFVMTSSSFGFYFIARQLVDLVLRFLISLDAQMGLQVFTHIGKSTAADFRRNYYRYRMLFDAIAGLAAGGLVVLAPLLVGIVFDERYRDVAWITQILILGVLPVGPLLLRSAFYAERRFKFMTGLGVVSAVTLWGGLVLAVLVAGSVTTGLFVVALHRVPEAMICLWRGRQRDWIALWRESIIYGFCAIGALLGWLVLRTWTLLT